MKSSEGDSSAVLAKGCIEYFGANAAPEWQAGTLERKQGIGGGLSTPGACYPFLYAVTLLWSAS